MAWNTGLACGLTATRSSGRSTWKYSAVISVTSEADDAWCPPTFRPSPRSDSWLAWWIMYDDSHSTLRSNSRRMSMSEACRGIMREASIRHSLLQGEVDQRLRVD
jgi:hypothetical protein